MSNCQDCIPQPFPHYLAVETISERNSIPCDERKNGMLVSVKSISGGNYVMYMLKGGDPCNNTNWKEYNSINELLNSYGMAQVDTEVSENLTITAQLLNENYPQAQAGFRVYYTKLNTYFTKLNNGDWVMSNNVNILYNNV